MNEPMLVEDRARQEALSAQIARIGTFAGMALANMVIEIGTNGEFSIAARFGAHKRLDALMEPQMLMQMARLCVRFSTNVTQVQARLCRSGRPIFGCGFDVQLVEMIHHGFG